MINMGIWREVNKWERNANKRLVGSKWVFKMKRNGVYRARLVAKGFSQIPGEAFTENFSPVINDVNFRIILTRMILEGLDAKVLDIDNALLNGNLDHEIFMKIPEGYKECIQDYDEDKALKLDKAIYGLVQAARQFWKKLTSKLKEAGSKPSIVDPCLFQCKDNRGSSILIMYNDDLLIIGKPETYESAIDYLIQYFDIKKPTTLDDYLSVQVIKSEDQKRAWLGQPMIIDALTKNFGEEVEKQRVTLTPGTLGFIGAKQNEEGA